VTNVADAVIILVIPARGKRRNGEKRLTFNGRHQGVPAMRTQSLLAICCSTAAALAVSACGGAGKSTAQATTAPTLQIPTSTPLPSALSAQAPPAGFPIGNYSGVLASQDDAPGTLSLDGDGRYQIVGGPAAGPLDIRGVYAVSGVQITFHETVGALCDQPGTYAWQSSGNTLKLTVVTDTCAGGARASDFAEHLWTRKP
jgi:hypothetical protein